MQGVPSLIVAQAWLALFNLLPFWHNQLAFCHASFGSVPPELLDTGGHMDAIHAI